MAKKDMKEASQEMSLEEAKAYRASLHRPVTKSLSEQEKREQFRLFWAKEKKKYIKTKDIEKIIWIHLKAVKLNDPEKFEEGLRHFGLKIK